MYPHLASRWGGLTHVEGNVGLPILISSNFGLFSFITRKDFFCQGIILLTFLRNTLFFDFKIIFNIGGQNEPAEMDD